MYYLVLCANEIYILILLLAYLQPSRVGSYELVVILTPEKRSVLYLNSTVKHQGFGRSQGILM